MSDRPALLADPKVTDAAKAQSLCWLMHLVVSCPLSNRSSATVSNKAIAMIGTPHLREAGEAAAKDLSVETWVKESHVLAERHFYTQEVIEHLDGQIDRKHLPPLELDDEYIKDGGSSAQTRLAEAGFRLELSRKWAEGASEDGRQRRLLGLWTRVYQRVGELSVTGGIRYNSGSQRSLLGDP